ncbi:MAG: Gldg family protein [Lachnospiraceae bacterium]|nr:Gldg family protein [Lachnospiraceae bacterium]
MWAVFKKEWLGSFRTMIGWIFLAVTIFFMGWYFRFYGLNSGLPYLSYIISASQFIFLFTLPLLTMRSFSEERRHKTDQLLFTAPVEVWEVVLGKYLAAACVFLPVIPVMMVYPCILGIYGEVPFAENALAILGFVFFGLSALAVGIFISALTENQVIAAVLTFFVLLLSVMIPSISTMISREGNVLTRALRILELTAPFDHSLYGVLHWPSYVYYLSVIAVALFLTVYLLTARRFHVRTHGILGAFGNIVKAVAFLGTVVAVNVICFMVPQEKQSIDMTYNGIRSLTPEGTAVIQALDKGVEIYVLVDPEEKDETLDATLKRMQELSGYLKVEYLSPEENPYFYLSYTDAEPVPNSMIVVCGRKSRVINYYDCYQVSYDYSYDVASGSYIATDYQVSGYDGEGRLTAAISYVTSDHVPKIYCITGHSELSLEDELKSRIENALYEVEEIKLLMHEEIPEDGDIIFILAPFSDLNEEDVAKVKGFLQKGKSAIFVVAYTDTAELTNYYSILEDYGIRVLPGVVHENDPDYCNMEPAFLLPEIVEGDLTEKIYTAGRTRYIYMPFAKGLRLVETADSTAMTFLRSTKESHTEGAEEEQGPFSLGVFAEHFGAESTSHIVVFSSDYFMYKDINLAVNGANYDLFMKALGKVSETEDMTDIPVKGYAYDPILIGSTAKDFYAAILIGVLPGALLACGLFIWYRRRHG